MLKSRRCNSNPSATSVEEEVGGQYNAAAALPPPATPTGNTHEVEWASGPVWTSTESLASTGSRSPGRPTRSSHFANYVIPVSINQLCSLEIK
jgi:hypothetical protein